MGRPAHGAFGSRMKKPGAAAFYAAMLERFGPSHWWPADSPFEVALGVVLTQNTSWKNVEKALANLRKLGPLTPAFIWNLPRQALETALRPAGFFSLKAGRLRNLLAFLAYKAGRQSPPEEDQLNCLRGTELAQLRRELLAVKGIGPESADSILLYGLDLPSFVADAYTWRILRRHGLVGEEAAYEELRDIFTAALPEEAQVYNECHALIVRVGKAYCRKQNPDCASCPLGKFLD